MPARRRTRPLRVFSRVQPVQWQALAVPLDPRRGFGVDDRAENTDHSAREVALFELPLDSSDAQRPGLAHATDYVDRECFEKILLAGLPQLGPLGPALLRSLSHQTAVRLGSACTSLMSRRLQKTRSESPL